MSLPAKGVYFVHQEWKLPDGSKLDLLGVEPATGRLVVIELKDSEQAARKNDGKKGGDAWRQAEHYARLVYEHREDLYPFFERLARAQARGVAAAEQLAELRVSMELEPRQLVWWPGSLGGR